MAMNLDSVDKTPQIDYINTVYGIIPNAIEVEGIIDIYRPTT